MIDELFQSKDAMSRLIVSAYDPQQCSSIESIEALDVLSRCKLSLRARACGDWKVIQHRTTSSAQAAVENYMD